MVRNVCAPSCMASGNFFKPLFIKTTSAVCMAICEASLIDIPILALASAGASLMPSPTMAVGDNSGLVFQFAAISVAVFVQQSLHRFPGFAAISDTFLFSVTAEQDGFNISFFKIGNHLKCLGSNFILHIYPSCRLIIFHQIDCMISIPAIFPMKAAEPALYSSPCILVAMNTLSFDLFNFFPADFRLNFPYPGQ